MPKDIVHDFLKFSEDNKNMDEVASVIAKIIPKYV